MRRRFIAFITLLVSAVVILLGSFTNVFTSINTGTEFSNGQSYVYQINLENEDDSGEQTTISTIEDAASEMNRRLKGANLNNFDVSIEGDDQIRVTFTGANASQSEHIKKLLSYNAHFSLTTTDDLQQADSEEIFDGSVARLEFRNQYPVIVIPISDTNKVEAIREHATTVKSPDGSEDSGNTEDAQIDYTMIVLWANKVEGDSFESAMDPNNEDYEKMQEKVLLAFSSAEDSFYFNEEKTEIAYAINVETAEDGTVNALSAKNAAIEAQRKIDLFNAGSLNYEVNFLYSLPADASVENIINYGSYANINWGSHLVISCIVACVLVSIALVVFYRLSAPVAIVSTASSLLATLAIFNVFGVEFSLGAFIGLLVVAGLGIFSNVYYFEKLKNELYRGRTLKKANSEASKKSTLPVIDASVVVLLASLITYFVGEPLVKGFAVMSSLGAAFNLIFCCFGTKGLMWLVTNETSMQDHKYRFAVDVTRIPNTQNEEKQSYFGPFVGKNIAKNSKKVGIVASAIALLGVALTLIFNFTIGTFNYGDNYSVSTRVQLVVEENSDINKVEVLADYLETLGFENGELSYSTGTDVDDSDLNLNYYIVDIKALPEDGAEIYTELDTYDGDKLATIQAYLETYYHGIDSDAQVKVYNVIPTAHTVNVWTVTLGILFGLLLSGAYVAIRYGLSKAITTFGVSAVSTFLTLALFIIFRITFTDVAAIGLLGIMNISLLLSLVINSREKEIHDEIKDVDEKEKLTMANDSAFGMMFNFVAYGLLASLGIVAFGPLSYTLVFVLIIMGLLISLLLNANLDLALTNKLKVLIAKIFTVKPRKERKGRRKKVVTKTNEPEEAIFIGIND